MTSRKCARGCRRALLASILFAPIPASAQQVAAPLPAKPVFRVPIRAGSKTIAGGIKLDAKPASVMVTILPVKPSSPNDVDTQNFIQRVLTSDIKEDGGFSVGLDQAVLEGQYVVACALDKDKKRAADGCSVEAVQDIGDWGRVRTYFAGGAMFSKSNGDFSQQDLALSFSLDKCWWERPIASGKDGWSLRGVNTLFDTRLTSVPVTTSAPTTTAGVGGATATSAPSLSDQFLASKKAAIVQVGIYSPIFRGSMTWMHKNQRNAVFFTPVFRAGIVTTVGATTTASSSGAQATPSASVADAI